MFLLMFLKKYKASNFYRIRSSYLSLTYMIYGTGAEFAEKLFGPEVFEVGDEERPQVKDVVT